MRQHARRLTKPQLQQPARAEHLRLPTAEVFQITIGQSLLGSGGAGEAVGWLAAAAVLARLVLTIA